MAAKRRTPLWLLLPIFVLAIAASHAGLLRLPYFWDEAGYYIPAAWDFFHTGTLIPQSTLTNAHPPLPSVLLAAWWHLFGFHILDTRLLVCCVAAIALLAVYRLCRTLADETTAVLTTLLTAIYPVWFAQSTLAHADIFATAFTLWALAIYLPALTDPQPPQQRDLLLIAGCFSLAALSKETAILTPLALAAWELWQALRSAAKRTHLVQAAAFAFPVLPLLCWYFYHRHKTGLFFGNPEYLRYNATANLDALRVALSLWHRLLHLTSHMNLFVPVAATVAVMLIPATRPRLPRAVNLAIAVVLATNLVAFSVLGGALLTRYLLPAYPLVLLSCVVEWRRRLSAGGLGWVALGALTAAGFLAGIFINPPYIFSPEDNLAYRDMIVVHQQAIEYLVQHYPQATVLTAWPATSELTRPELGYTDHPLRVDAIPNFTFGNLSQAASDPGGFDTALLFSTKCEPTPGSLDLGRIHAAADARYFDLHHDLPPAQAATLLHGDLVWQTRRGCEWAAVLHFPRIVEARLRP